MTPDRVWKFEPTPAWRPLTDNDVIGYVVLALAAAALVGMTLWTYLGAAQTTPRRLAALVGLRLLALLAALLMAVRPSLVVEETPRLPSTLIIVLDASESMTVNDEHNNYSRWDVLRNAVARSQPILDQLRDEQQVTVHLYRFAADFDPNRDKYDPDGVANGKRTDFGTMLARLYDMYQAEPRLRGLIVLSDGADNGTATPALAEAAKWRGLNCPVYTFALGSPSTSSKERDIRITTISPDPSPVPVKADLTVRALVDAQGFERAKVQVRLLFDDKLVKTEDVDLLKPTGNEIAITTKAPAKPGEIKVTLQIDPLPGEVSPLNNTIETYLTVTKEGVRVLVIDRLRLELAFLRRALASDKRFDYVEVIRQTTPAGGGADPKLLGLADEAYDVIILGDVSPGRLAAGNPQVLEQIADLVTNRGVGLMMTGGIDSFGGTPGTPDAGGWAGTPIGRLLPVEVSSAPQIDDELEIELTPQGKSDYVLKLDADAGKNAKLWARLNEKATRLKGMTPLGKLKPGATVLAEALFKDKGGRASRQPLLVGQEIGKARILAFGADSTWRWSRLGVAEGSKNPKEGLDLHARFWKQAVLWLAHQEEVEGNVFVRPEYRRLAVDGRQVLTMGVRDKQGKEIPNADVRYQVLKPGEQPDESKAQRPRRDAKDQFSAGFVAGQPGEYRVVVWGKGKDPDGKEIAGDASARFIVYPEVSDEMLRPAANHAFLLALENTANGTMTEQVRRADQLPQFLEKLKSQPLTGTQPDVKRYPDWRRDSSRMFLPGVLILFVAILGLEWGLRRAWGMV